LRVNPRSTTSCGGLSGCSHTPDPDGFPEGSRHSHIGSFALANKCPLHSKEHSSGRASHVFGNPSGSGLLKIPNGRRQEARRPGILAPDNPPRKRVCQKRERCAERGSARLVCEARRRPRPSRSRVQAIEDWLGRGHPCPCEMTLTTRGLVVLLTLTLLAMAFLILVVLRGPHHETKAYDEND
jgi:hypothetical protein